MWTNTDIVQIANLSSTTYNNTELITFVTFKNQKLYVGRADGKFECYNDPQTKHYELQSHVSEFDYLESSDIQEKIVCAEIIQDGGISDILFLSNEKSIKVWNCKLDIPTAKIISKEVNIQPVTNNKNREAKNVIPRKSKLMYKSGSYKFDMLKEQRNIHLYTINSLHSSLNSEYLLSSDYLKINLWCTRNMDKAFCIIDIKPTRYEELAYVITSSRFKCDDDMVFGYSTSKGEINIQDLRIKSSSGKVMTMGKRTNSSVFDDLMKSISDFRFCDDHTIVARDLSSLTLFDTRNTNKELKSVKVFHSDGNLIDDIFESQTAYEKFLVEVSQNKIVTGNFGNKIFILDKVSFATEEISVGEISDLEIVDFSTRIRNIAVENNNIVAALGDQCYFYKNVDV
ncbi:regulatory subunit B of Ser/Thr protein phosphatase 2A [Hamiltosporidium tvaerminnensis]|uniref:Regulatory subunit B of Ser/Thr protein phosphatase 2A n=2 Tax=Hamiltosporidium tvaerminnensis TaxID=1176355 RepID=A0A4Q9M069_9MICR|nr:regulatory subunit B of Ser/Thr protein phosphatase 2A [Hamiltosporidium tvaerminnensis]